MKKTIKKYMLYTAYLLSILLLSFCSSDKDVNYFHRVTPVEEVYSTFIDGDRHFTPDKINLDVDTIFINYPYYYPIDSEDKIDVTRMQLHIKFNPEVKVETEIPNVVDMSTPFIIDIVNADGAKEKLTIVGDVRKSSLAEITHFSLPDVSVYGNIIESTKEVGIMKEGKDLSNQVPTIKISAGATIHPDPSVAQNFNNEVEYTLTAQDGTVVKYTVTDINKLNNFEIKKGVNIASWLSTPKYHGEQRKAFFNENDVKLLSDLGFDHIRVCFDEIYLWDDAGQKIRPYAFDLLHDAIAWCMKYNMRVLIDLHITRNHRFTQDENALFTDPNEPAKFVKLWQDLSDELKGYPNSVVAYELLNEPVSKDSENWNRVAALAINAIRARETDRTIVVGVCTTNATPRYDVLKLPSTHKILMTFHYYGPYLLTAYGLQSTTGGRQDIPISYPGRLVAEEDIHLLPPSWQSTGRNYYDRSSLESGLMKGIDKAQKLGVPVFVGEFGTLYATPEPSRSNWYRDMVSIMGEKNIGYTSFDYKGAGYSVVSEDLSLRYPNLINILTNK